MTWIEANFDGIVGPTHNYAGLAFGNLASQAHAKTASSPKQAAKQGIAKMRCLYELGIVQAVLPPHPRPNIELLRQVGFSGTIAQILQQANRSAPQLLAACYSVSGMWVANAATTSPGCHTQDGKTHLTPANLVSHLHRSQECHMNHLLLKAIFCNTDFFHIHAPLPSDSVFGDEGAANHAYITTQYGESGLELFVFGKAAFNGKLQPPKHFPARQTLEACESLVRKHGLIEKNVITLQQHPHAIDQGSFHNDVVFLSNKNVLVYHQQAFVDVTPLTQRCVAQIEPVYLLEISEKELSLSQAVESYLFNSQLVSTKSGEMVLVAPLESQAEAPKRVIDQLIAGENPVKAVKFVDCRESMHNGGGPACLRLRVQMPAEALSTLGGEVLYTPELGDKLNAWVDRHYRDSLQPEDLLDPSLYTENCVALDELTKLLALGSIYPFQQV